MLELKKLCFDFNFRPNASHGIWLAGLLFSAFFQTIIRNPKTIQLNYEVTTVLLLGMFLQTLEVFFTFVREDSKLFMKLATRIAPSIVTNLLLGRVLHQEVVFSIATSLTTQLSFRFIYLSVMRSFPLSFTMGEASIVAQGFIVFIYNSLLDRPYATRDIDLVLQIGILGVIALIFSTYFITIFRKWFMFYFLLVAVVIGICVVPVGTKLAVTILFNFIFNDTERIVIVCIYIALLVFAGFIVNWQIGKNERGSTRARKLFHILIVMVFVPGLLYQCQFLYVASVLALAVFTTLELARCIQLHPFAEILQSSVAAFIDEKDSGRVAMTPIYLLVGCSLPLWIHNSPCDLTGSSSSELLPLMSGVLSIGVGDTFASVFGSKFGRHKWPKSQKSVEGTIASIIAQAIFIYALYASAVMPLTLRLTAVCGFAVISNSLVEALTDQVDNLVLPLITYCILAIK